MDSFKGGVSAESSNPQALDSIFNLRNLHNTMNFILDANPKQ